MTTTNDTTYNELTAADTAADIRNDFHTFYETLTNTEQRILRENPDHDIAELLATLDGYETA